MKQIGQQYEPCIYNLDSTKETWVS